MPERELPETVPVNFAAVANDPPDTVKVCDPFVQPEPPVTTVAVDNCMMGLLTLSNDHVLEMVGAVAHPPPDTLAALVEGSTE